MARPAQERPKSKPIGDSFAWADGICARAFDRIDAVTDRDLDFCTKLATRLDRYGVNTLLSDKQREWLADIERKLEGDDGR